LALPGGVAGDTSEVEAVPSEGRTFPGANGAPAPAPIRAAAAAPLRASRPTAVPARQRRGRPRGSAGGLARRRIEPRYAALLVGGAIVVGAGAVAAATQLFGGSSSDKATVVAPSTKEQGGRASSNAPGRVVVTVLNGTSVTGLARSVLKKLTDAGYRPGPDTPVDTFSDQTVSATTVNYEAGYLPAAKAVARTIGLDPAAVARMTPSAKVLADRTARVVVVLGSDYSP